MSVSSVSYERLTLPIPLGWAMVPAGLLAVFATYWDEAFHTDVGRDKAWSAPHLLLYGSVGVVGLGVAYWGVRQHLASRNVRRSLGNLPLTAAGLGALAALVAAPIDIFWHQTYGRDAVLWSPPHMLALLGAIALGLGVAAGVPARQRTLRATAGVLVLANAVVVVFEYEADVPQFPEALYLPILITLGLAVAMIMEDLLGRVGVALVAVGYAATRIAIVAGLALVGRSTPDLPIAILGLALWSLPLRTRWERAAVAAAAMAGLALVSSTYGAASQPVDSVAVGAVPTLVGAALALTAVRTRLLAASAVLAGAAVMTVAPHEPAVAHDPGQGEPVVPVELSGRASGNDLIITATLASHCDDLEPVQAVARRAGIATTVPLTVASRDCSYRGRITVPTGGRWFTYVEFRHEGQILEAWLPLEAGSATVITQERDLYLPSGGGQGATTLKVVLSGLMYLLGLAFIALGVLAVRQTCPTRLRGA